MNIVFRLLAMCTIVHASALGAERRRLSSYRPSRMELYVDGVSYDTTNLCNNIATATCIVDDRDGYKRISMTAPDDEIQNAFQQLLSVIQAAAPCNGAPPLSTLTEDTTGKRFVWGACGPVRFG